MVKSSNITKEPNNMLPLYRSIKDETEIPVINDLLSRKLAELCKTPDKYSSQFLKKHPEYTNVKLDSIQTLKYELKEYDMKYENNTNFKKWIKGSKNKVGSGVVPGYKQVFGRYRYYEYIVQFRKDNDIEYLHELENKYNINKQEYYETCKEINIYNERLKTMMDSLGNFASQDTIHPCKIQNNEVTDAIDSVMQKHKCSFVKYKTCITTYKNESRYRKKRYYKCKTCHMKKKK